MPATKTAFSSQPAPIASIPTFLTGPQAEGLESAVYEKIRQRAYLLFEESGRAPGKEDANWLEAESQVFHAGMDVRETATWVSLNAFIPEAVAQSLQIVVRPKRVLVRATATRKLNSVAASASDERAIFLAANLPAEVDPETAAASFRDHGLRLMIRKRTPDRLPTS
jgi:HSP20 family molecular chaperone IbpA